MSVLDNITAAPEGAMTASESRPVDTGNDPLSELATPVVSLQAHLNFMAAVLRGEHAVEAIQLAFRILVASKAAVQADLGKLTVKELTKLARPSYAGLRKAQLIALSWDELLMGFAWLTTGDKGGLVRSGLGDTAAYVHKVLADLNAEGLAVHLDYRRQLAEKQRARWMASLDALRDPKTLNDFTRFIEVRGRQALTPEQSARYDDLVAASELVRKPAQRMSAGGSISGEPVETTSMARGASSPLLELVKTRHTKKGHEIFVAKMNLRVDRSEFDRLCREAKACRGYYSSFRGPGATPGFTFEVETDATLFMARSQPTTPAGGQPSDEVATVAAPEEEVAGLADRPSSHPEATAGVEGESDARHDDDDGSAEIPASGAELMPSMQSSLVAPANAIRLEALADRLSLAVAEAKGRQRLVNTRKRAAEAARALKAAAAKEQLARTIRHIAAGMRSGETKYLGEVRDGAQVELLDLLVRSAHIAHMRSLGCPVSCSEEEIEVVEDCAAFAEMPRFSAHASQLSSLIRALEKKSGCGRLRQRLRALLDACAPENAPTQYAGVEDVRQCIAILGRITSSEVPWHWIESSDRLARLERLGVRRVEHLRALLREFIRFRAGAPAVVDRVRAAELALVGRKVGIDFFPTPKHLAARMVSMAGVKPGMRALEPQAGAAAIAEELRAAGADTSVCEISSELRQLLLLKGFVLVGDDFLQHVPEAKYQVIVANPPFGANADIQHFNHAIDVALEDGGTLVSVIGEGAFTREGRVERAFRERLAQLQAHVESLPPGTFSDRSLLNTTSANARLVMVRKL